jgi:hypothetical protein
MSNYDLLFYRKEYFTSTPDIHIVYYSFLSEPRWRSIVYGQCNDILSSEIPAFVSFVICTHPETVHLLEECSNWIHKTFKEYIYGFER